MKSKFHFSLQLFLLFKISFAQIQIGNSDLSIALQNNGNGLELSSFTSNGQELLEEHSYLFYLYITNLQTGVETRISATSDWENVEITNDNSSAEIVFSEPSLTSLPESLNVTININVIENRSQWDISVNGIGDDYTLTQVNFPKFKFKVNPNDKFFVPKFSGILIDNPYDSGISYELTYPRGRLGASMPFSAYINTEGPSIYMAYHDPTASLKDFIIQKENNYIKYYGRHIIPNKSLPSNNWELPGIFELDIFQGSWYEAAMIYKDWAMNNAPYFPQDLPERTNRQHSIGEIAVWGSVQPALTYSVSDTENDINVFTNFFPSYIPVGIHWYKWNNHYQDDDYPDYFPERDGFVEAVNNIQQNGNHIMPYTNGMLYDTDLPTYTHEGLPYATKDINGDPYTIYFQDSEEGAPNTLFAFMCSTQSTWQTTLANVFDELANRIQTKGIYVDMVAWAGAKECMDTTHGHPLGSGHWWHDGYVEMLSLMHNKNQDTYLTVEGATDDMADVVDGFYVGEWRVNNMVPAFQSIYTGKNQFFGMSYGGSTYNDPSFYAKFAYSYVNNIQPGRFYLYFAQDPDAEQARPFILDLVKMRYKLRNFMSYGEMKKPFEIEGDIPVITSDWGVGDVSISQLQKNIYINQSKDTLAYVFANASMTEAVDFQFDFNTSVDYGINPEYNINIIKPDTEETIQVDENNTTISIHLEPKESIAYFVSHLTTTTVDNSSNTNISVYPIPSSSLLNIELANDTIKQLEIMDINGKKIYSAKEKKSIDLSALKKGIYILKIITEKGNTYRKVIKK